MDITTKKPRRNIELRLEVEDELENAYNLFGYKPWSRHEFYAILLEELEELWEGIKNDGTSAGIRQEMIQIVAVVYRYGDVNGKEGDL